jgi:hypothetical protein
VTNVGGTKLETMILLPWSKRLVSVRAVVGAATDEDTAFVLPEACFVVVAAPLFTLRPRLPLRMPRLRGFEEMMSAHTD